MYADFFGDLYMVRLPCVRSRPSMFVQRNDIAAAIGKADEFDCLIDIVPREEVKSTRLRVRQVSAEQST